MLPPPFEGSLEQCSETGSFWGLSTGFNVCFAAGSGATLCLASVQAKEGRGYRQFQEPIWMLPRFSVQRVTSPHAYPSTPHRWFDRPSDRTTCVRASHKLHFAIAALSLAAQFPRFDACGRADDGASGIGAVRST